MSRRVVVTGLGLLAPSGAGAPAVWSSILAGKPALRRITRFDTTGFRCRWGGELEGFDPLRFMPVRLSRKLDPYTQYAVAACDMALKDAAIDLEKVDRSMFGVYAGNCFGGWAV